MKKTVCTMFALFFIMCFCSISYAADYIYSASVEGVISMHISPSDESYIITQVPACSKMRLIMTERTWGLVEFKNKCGWINLSFTRSSYDKAAEATGNDFAKNVRVSAEEKKAVLYNIPSLSEALGSEEKYTVPNDMVLQIKRETSSGWGLVSMNGKYAWIQMKNTKKYETDAKKSADKYGIYYVYVLSDEGAGIKLRSKAGKGEVYAVIPDCVKLTVRETKGKYGYVSYDGINGWIELSETAQSLANAQSNAGVQVNSEFVVNEGEEREIFSVPSENAADGGYVVGKIKGGETVFVLRNTLNGWSLINHNGTLGWLQPDTLSPAKAQNENMTEVFSLARQEYVSSKELKGMKLFALPKSEEAIATVPESVKINVLAEKDGYEYIYCDYASGWAEKGCSVSNYEEAVENGLLKKKEYYLIKDETALMSMPVYSALCMSQELSVMSVGAFFEVSKIVSTGKRKWALTTIDGKRGWINLNCARKTTSPLVLVVTALLTVGVLVLLVISVHNILKKKGKGDLRWRKKAMK